MATVNVLHNSPEEHVRNHEPATRVADTSVFESAEKNCSQGERGLPNQPYEIGIASNPLFIFSSDRHSCSAIMCQLSSPRTSKFSIDACAIVPLIGGKKP